MEEDNLRLERKFMRGSGGLALSEAGRITGYASLFGQVDQGGDIVLPGAYRASLEALAQAGGKVRMLWQHDPMQPVGIWEEITEDSRGLRVTGRLLPEVARAREAEALIAAGALDGLSIGYRTVKSSRDTAGRRLLAQVDLCEISLVTFPMQREARIEAKTGEMIPFLTRLTAHLAGARQQLAGL